MDPDELVRENLVCVYDSSPTDVKTKRRRTDWLDEYVNDHLLNKGLGMKRASSAPTCCPPSLSHPCGRHRLIGAAMGQCRNMHRDVSAMGSG